MGLFYVIFVDNDVEANQQGALEWGRTCNVMDRKNICALLLKEVGSLVGERQVCG
jgi:hypothetical protein